MKQKLSFKIVAIILVIFMLIASVFIGLSGFSLTSDPVVPAASSVSSDISEPTVQKVTLVITSPDDSELVNTELNVTSISALEATKNYLTSQDIPFEANEATLVSINEIASTETEGWVLYVNDVLSEVNPSTVIVKNDTQLTWKWETFSETSITGSSSTAETSSEA